MEAPPPPTAPPAPTHEALHPATGPVAPYEDPLAAPRKIPPGIFIAEKPEVAPSSNIATMDLETGIPGALNEAFHSQPAPRVVPAAPKGLTHLTSTMAAGLLLRKVVPQYPAVARATHTGGTVVLAATISKEGTIINLRVVSGSPLLQQAALDAVSQWRYRPYLLNGQPVDVETTVNVIFTLGQ
jgi:protein TonB